MNLEIDLGLDSLARAETFAAIEHAFSMEFSADDAARAFTIRSIVGMIEDSDSSEAYAGGTTAIERAPQKGVELDWTGILEKANGDYPEVRAVLRKNTLFAIFAYSVFRLFYLFCKVFMRLEVEGRENLVKMLPDEPGPVRPFLICPNHQSYLDAFIVCSVYPYRVFKNIFHVGTSGIFRGRIMETVARLLYVVPIDPDTQLMRAMRAGAMGLRAGKILNIYPEGERSYDGRLHEFKKGAAILATEVGVPIIPVALDGAYKVWPRGSWRIRPAKVKMRFGEPISPQDSADRSTSESAYAELTDRIKGDILSMIEDMRSDHA